LVAGIGGSNPSEGMDVRVCVYMLRFPVSIEAFANPTTCLIRVRNPKGHRKSSRDVKKAYTFFRNRNKKHERQETVQLHLTYECTRVNQ
jgi:hypothetical protein